MVQMRRADFREENHQFIGGGGERQLCGQVLAGG